MACGREREEKKKKSEGGEIWNNSVCFRSCNIIMLSPLLMVDYVSNRNARTTRTNRTDSLVYLQDLKEFEIEFAYVAEIK